MIPYIYAKELKKKYIVYGSFYNTTYNNESVSCRNLLEIYDRIHFRKTCFNNLLEPIHIRSLLAKQKQEIPDAIFIMMNPGSSKPLKPNYAISKFLNDAQLPQKILNNPLVITKPDKAQYQIMNVMNYKNWKHIRVINLSDICEAKSSIFIKKVVLINKGTHSIFSKERVEELKVALSTQCLPTFAAWGRDEKLIPLANKCLASLPETHKPKGVQYHEDDFRLYAYASPPRKEDKLKWLELIQDAIDSK